MRYSFTSKAVGKAVTEFIMCLCELHKLDWTLGELVQLTCILCCETTIKLIKDRKLAFISTVY